MTDEYSAVAMLASALGIATTPELREIAEFDGAPAAFDAAVQRAFQRFADDKRIRLGREIVALDKRPSATETLGETLARARFLLETWRA